MNSLPELPGFSLQSMPGKWAGFCLNTTGFIQDRLSVSLSGTTLLIGFSTGIDSTALLLWAKAMAGRNGFAVRAAHCNHGLRPESEHEAVMAAHICKTLDIPLHLDTLPVRAHCLAHKLGVEEGARELRYAFLHRTADAIGADWILTGHHQNDLAEDMVMRLIRGTGWPGLTGMQAVDRSRKLLRPFLHTPKTVLQQFLIDLDIPWCEDESNGDLSLRRNRVRHEILPLLLRENPAFLDSVSRLWDQGDRDGTYWEERTESGVVIMEDKRMLIPTPMLAEHPALRYRLYKKALDRLGPGQVLSDSLDRLDRIVAERKTGKMVQFPGDKVARLGRDGLEFFIMERMRD